MPRPARSTGTSSGGLARRQPVVSASGVRTGMVSVAASRVASYTSIRVRSRRAARKAALSVASLRSVVNRAAASGWSMTRTSMGRTLMEPGPADRRPNHMLADTDAIRALGSANSTHAADLAEVAATLSSLPVPAASPLGPIGARFMSALAEAAAEGSRAVTALGYRGFQRRARPPMPLPPPTRRPTTAPALASRRCSRAECAGRGADGPDP